MLPFSSGGVFRALPGPLFCMFLWRGYLKCPYNMSYMACQEVLIWTAGKIYTAVLIH
jgi:hypothetical protein